MVEISLNNKTVDAIYEWSLNQYQASQQSRGQSSPLRCSSLGDQCSRKLWYKANGYEQEDTIDGRKARLFERGDLEENRFVTALRGVGIKVWGDQQQVIGLDGKLKGHIDGLALGILEAPETPHLLEFKTHNSRNFKMLERKGVEAAHFKHFVQCQMYMGLLGITRAFYLAVNKDDDSLYSERIKFDKDFFNAQLTRAERIVSMKSEPARINDNPAFHLCKMCEFRSICHSSSLGKERKTK